MNIGHPRAVIDTNVLFEGLTKQGGAAGLILEAWSAALFYACVSNALAYEYLDVLTRKLSPARWERMRPVLGALLEQAIFIPNHFTWRPISPDPADDHVVDCAMNAGAPIVTYNVKDFRNATQILEVPVMTPLEFVHWLTEVT
ncbi:MAG: PIN domain-containing protein [Anaerolineales bacterium]